AFINPKFLPCCVVSASTARHQQPRKQKPSPKSPFHIDNLRLPPRGTTGKKLNLVSVAGEEAPVSEPARFVRFQKPAGSETGAPFEVIFFLARPWKQSHSSQDKTSA